MKRLDINKLLKHICPKVVFKEHKYHKIHIMNPNLMLLQCLLHTVQPTLESKLQNYKIPMCIAPLFLAQHRTSAQLSILFNKNIMLVDFNSQVRALKTRQTTDTSNAIPKGSLFLPSYFGKKYLRKTNREIILGQIREKPFTKKALLIMVIFDDD